MELTGGLRGRGIRELLELTGGLRGRGMSPINAKLLSDVTKGCLRFENPNLTE